MDTKEFAKGIQSLRELGIAEKIANYTPPKSSGLLFDDLFGQEGSLPVDGAGESQDTQLGSLYAKYSELHQTTKDNLFKFSQPGYKLKSHATGDTEVTRLVSRTG